MLFDANQVADGDYVRGGFGSRADAVEAEEGACPTQAGPWHLCQLGVATHGYGSVLADVDHYGRHQAPDRSGVRQGGSGGVKIYLAVGEGHDVDAILGAAIAAAAVVGDQPAPHGLLRRCLQFRVQRGVGDEAGVDVLPVSLEQFAPHPLGRIGGREIDLALKDLGGNRHCHGLLVFRLIDRAQLAHSAQYQIAACQRPLGTVDGIAALRLLDDASQHGELRQIQFANRLAVVGMGGGLHPIGVFAERHDVHVELENLVLAELPLYLQGQQHLLELADELLLVAERDDFR